MVHWNIETAAMLIYQTDPLEVELFSYVNTFFSINLHGCCHVSENELLSYFKEHFTLRRTTAHVS